MKQCSNNRTSCRLSLYTILNCINYKFSLQFVGLTKKKTDWIRSRSYGPSNTLGSTSFQQPKLGPQSFSFFYKNTFPGFMIQFGSNNALISFMTDSPVGPISSGNIACLPLPMPCSPVHVPPMANARLQ